MGGVADLNTSIVEAPLSLEYVDVESVGLDPDDITAAELMAWCAGAVRAFALHPDGVRLVITGDFVRSVRERSVTQHQQENYHVERNAGEVGAKTMPRTDGTIDVVVPAWWFAPDPDEAIVVGRAAIARRTVVHEAFHVAMHQGKETSPGYGEEEWVRMNMLAVSDTVMEEYRAEVSVSADLRAGDDTEWDPLSVVLHLKGALSRIAAQEYQGHLDVNRLCYDVGQECMHFWQLVGYVVAAHVQDDGTVAPLAEDVVSDPVWDWMVGPHWDRFVEILTNIPPALTRTTRADLEPSVRALADELHSWLETLGFLWKQDEDGAIEFRIVHWNFYESDEEGSRP